MTAAIGARRHDRVRNEAVEIVAAWHCNIRCASCAFGSPSAAAAFADPDQVERDLTALARWLEVRHVRILGGEPLLHPRFLDLVGAVRRSGLAPTIRVVTNGIALLKAPPAVWQAVDEIHVSLYPNLRRLIESRIDGLRATARATGVRLRIESFDHFRLSFRRPDEDAALTQRIYRTCQMAHLWRSLTAQDGLLHRCLQSVHIRDRFGQGGDDGAHEGVHDGDALDIARIGSSAELDAWLRRPSALDSCTRCFGSVGARHRHSLLAPQAEDGYAGEEAVDRDYLRRLEASLDHDNACVSAATTFGAA